MEGLDEYIRDVLDGADSTYEFRFYIFGSATRSEEPRDVDILLIYADGFLPEAHACAEHMRAKLVLPPCDVLVASETEAAQLDLIVRQQAIAILLAPVTD